MGERDVTSSEGAPTRERILEASLRLFNEKGYAGTTVAAIADEVGITVGNLWYHFRTKEDLVRALDTQVLRRAHALREHGRGDTAAESLASSVLLSARNTWTHHFLFRDAALFRRGGLSAHRDPEMMTDLVGLQGLVQGIEKEGLFRSDIDVDLAEIARSLWMVGRHWPDHLREIDGTDTLDRADEERGVRQLIAVLLPWLTADGRRQVEAAFAVALEEWDLDPSEGRSR